MAKEHWIKYSLYAVGAFLFYEKIWPTLSSDVSMIGRKVTSTIANYGNTGIISVTNPSGSQEPGIPLSASNVAASNNIGLQSPYYITSQDRTNIASLTPSNTTNLSFDKWGQYYTQAKGMDVPLSALMVDLDPTTEISLDQFILLFNAKVSAGYLTGLHGYGFVPGHYGLQAYNRWYGVI